MWAGLVYRDSTGKTSDVWKVLGMASPAVQTTNQFAMFLGGVYEKGDFNDRLIVFEVSNGPPADITEQVFQRYFAESGVKREDIQQDTIVSLLETNGEIEINFGILKKNVRSPGDIMAGDGNEIISWNDIKAMSADVKKNGKLEKERSSGFDYFKKD
ncbi:MAG TPA: hypothetical protein VH280_00280 [Verrucomicrobiae bacterium]|jgi:hypothetical protein|nr:hypothetical protein [Verrucomicrobiae bacterium]